MTAPRHTARQPELTVWGAISFHRRTPLVVIRGTLTEQWYVGDILLPLCCPSYHNIPGVNFSKIMPARTPRQLFLRLGFVLAQYYFCQISRRISPPIANVYTIMGRILQLARDFSVLTRHWTEFSTISRPITSANSINQFQVE